MDAPYGQAGRLPVAYCPSPPTKIGERRRVLLVGGRQLGALVGGVTNGTHPPTARQGTAQHGSQRKQNPNFKFGFTLRPLHIHAGPLNRTPARGQRGRAARSNASILSASDQRFISRLVASLEVFTANLPDAIGAFSGGAAIEIRGAALTSNPWTLTT